MKKFIIAVVIAVFFATNCFAATTQVKTMASALACGKNATVYSNVLGVGDLAGHVGVRLISTAGSITVTQQCSIDGTTFYDPVDTSATALGQVVAVQTVTTGVYVVPDVVLAPYIRYKIVEGNVAATAVTINLVTLRD